MYVRGHEGGRQTNFVSVVGFEVREKVGEGGARREGGETVDQEMRVTHIHMHMHTHNTHVEPLSTYTHAHNHAHTHPTVDTYIHTHH